MLVCIYFYYLVICYALCYVCTILLIHYYVVCCLRVFFVSCQFYKIMYCSVLPDSRGGKSTSNDLFFVEKMWRLENIKRSSRDVVRRNILPGVVQQAGSSVNTKTRHSSTQRTAVNPTQSRFVVAIVHGYLYN